MPRETISESNRPSDGERFDRLKLETGEFARFMMPELPWKEWVHELRSIDIENGVGVKEVKKRRDGTEYEDWKRVFVGRPICLGDAGILQDKGIDPANCPACADGHKPVPRYAVNIIRYDLAGGQPRVPFGAKVIIWSFTAKMYGKLIDTQNGIGDLRQHDLTLRCEDGYWQRNELGFVQGAYCLHNSEARQYVQVLWGTAGNKATDEQLKDACGSDRTRDQMLEDCAKISLATQRALNAGAASSIDPTGGVQAGASQDLSQSLDALLATSTAANGVLPVPAGQAAAVTSQANALFGAPAPGLGSLSEFMSDEQKAAALAGVQAAKAEAQQSLAAMSDPFATPAAPSATTTSTAVPVAGNLSAAGPSPAGGAPSADPFASPALSALPASTSEASASTQTVLPSEAASAPQQNFSFDELMKMADGSQ